MKYSSHRADKFVVEFIPSAIMLTVSGYHLKTRLGNCELPTATVTITYVSGLLFHMWICTGTRTLTDKLQTVLLNTANTPRCRRLSSRPLRDAAPGRRRAATARASCRGVPPDRRPRTARAPAPRAPSAACAAREAREAAKVELEHRGPAREAHVPPGLRWQRGPPDVLLPRRVRRRRTFISPLICD